MAKFRIDSIEAAANGDVHLDVWVLKEVDNPEPPPDTVDVLVPNGHRTAVLPGAAVLAILESAGTDQQKVGALAALFREVVEGWGIVLADEATEGILGLVGDLPITVTL